MALQVGIADTAVYAPQRWEPAASLSAKTGIPESVIMEKFGLKGKHIAAPDEHASDLAVKAARPILARHDPDQVGAVIYFGSPYKDYPVWMASAKIAHELGCRKAFAFEVGNVSCGLPTALKVAKGLFAEDPGLDQVLLAGGCRESHMLSYDNPRARFMFNFGDGGAALLLRRDHPNQLLATQLITDGSFWHDVKVPAGGTVIPASRETAESGWMHQIDVADPESMKQRLDPVSLPRFVAAAQGALRRSGATTADVRLFAMLHTKRSLFAQVLGALGLAQEQAIYLDTWGHMSALDPAVALHTARESGRLKAGDLVLLLSAGTGYSWGASCIRWG